MLRAFPSNQRIEIYMVGEDLLLSERNAVQLFAASFLFLFCKLESKNLRL